MKLELLIFGVIFFIAMNIYHDGKYTKILYSYKKHFRIGFIIFLGILFYVMIKRNPGKCKNILLHANNVIKYMPIDKTSMDMISPIIDFTTKSNGYGGGMVGGGMVGGGGSNNFMHEMNQNTNTNINTNGIAPTKRSVSETKKKYVASNQDWKCGNCNNQLNAWYEVDHKIRLEHGGSNEVQNLVALCRECHGQKTAMENM